MKPTFEELFASLEKDPEYLHEALQVAKDIIIEQTRQREALIERMERMCARFESREFRKRNPALVDGCSVSAIKLRKIINEAKDRRV